MTLPILSSRSIAEFRKIEQEKAHTVRGEIRAALLLAARKLEALSDMADMEFARTEREMKEEASCFAGFLSEVCRVQDELLFDLMATASDNTGAVSDTSDPLMKTIVSDAVNDNWMPYFDLAAIGAIQEPKFYRDRYARQISKVLAFPWLRNGGPAK